MKKVILLLTVAACCIMACTGNQQKKTNMETDNATLVRLETTLGNITVKLYNETPKHRDNFIKLVKEGVYDSLLFHRVIKNFMVQAGDPDSKNANDTASLGYGDVGYTVPAEFNPALFHKKGALAAARQGDDVNPEKASSGCQFYIVTGKKYSQAQLINMENQINEARLDTAFNVLDTLEAQARAEVAKEPRFRFTKQQIDAYTTLGGTPHLDGNYTVFGEVVDGMNVVDQIETAKTNGADRPLTNIRILKAVVVE